MTIADQPPAPVSTTKPERDDFDDDDPWNSPGAVCNHCSGTGGDPWNDGITPCEHCDGEGYEWWK
jgi:hypothetical protein